MIIDSFICKKELIKMEEVKSFMRILDDYDDELIKLLVDTAIEMIEVFTGITLFYTTYTMSFDRDDILLCKPIGSNFSYGYTYSLFYDGLPYHMIMENIDIPHTNLQDVISIKVTGIDGVEKTINPIDYELDRQMCRVRFKKSIFTYLSTGLNQFNCLNLVYTAGYDSPHNVTSTIRTAILYLVNHLYSSRGGDSCGSSVIPETIKTLLIPIMSIRGNMS